MSSSLSRLAFAARAPVALRRAAFVTPVRYNSSTANQRTTEHSASPAAVSQTESEQHMDASTAEGSVLAAAIISGAPPELQTRTVRIYKPSKPATQSSNWPGTRWKMDWDVLTRRGNWENPLMGWISSADHMQGTHIWFKSKEDAIHFAEKQGYEYYVQEPNVRAFRPKQYAANFTHSPGKLKIIRTK